MNKLSHLFEKLALLTQFGLALITPTLICVFICLFLVSRLNFGVWVYIPGFIFGIGGSFVFAYKFYLSQQAEKESNEKHYFNQHD